MKKIILPLVILSLLIGCSKEEEKLPLELSAVTVPASSESDTVSAQSTEPPTEAETEGSTEKKISKKVKKKLKEMTLQDKICQMFIVVPQSVPWYDNMLFVDDWFISCYQDYPVGGFIYFDSNISYDEQLRMLIAQTQETAMNKGIGVFQAVDEEGGAVTRVQNTLGIVPAVDSMREYGRLNDSDAAYEAGRTIGGYLNDYGFNLDFAPVADVDISKGNELGSRIFSSDPLVVADMCTAVIGGLRSQNICSTLKHFPGLGAGSGNTHDGKVEIDRTLEQLRAEEFLAFNGGIEAGADFVMVGHQTMSAAEDELPGDLSSVVVTDWLRGELKYDGLIITDSQAMGAIANTYSADEAAVMSIKAGVDIILMPADLRTAVDGVKTAVNTGKIPIERINESVIRILEKKEEMGLLK